MTQPPTNPPLARLHIDPPLVHRQVTPRNGRTTPVIATGHQPTLWHPGILAKDLAADAFAKHVGGHAMHVVVEHNPIDPLHLMLPTIAGDALRARKLMIDLREQARTTPPNRLPAIDPPDVVQRLMDQAEADGVPDQVKAGLRSIAHAYETAGPREHLAAQTLAVLGELKKPYLHEKMQTRPTSGLVTQGFLDRLLRDPAGCARYYNRAAAAYPEARIRPLYAARDVVEVPLWAQGDGACMPVYIDLGDTKKPLLFTHDQALNLTGADALQHLRPRAISLSAIMRSEHCDLFIHGTGGGVYDQVTERWWHDWTGQQGLAPMAVVSADVYLPFEVPAATPAQHANAQWLAHHLPHNIDRYTEPVDNIDTALRQEKRELLDHMDADRNKRRRAAAFNRIHAINTELARLHQDALDQAGQRSADSRIGLANSKIATRRDWCFALYPDEQMRALSDQINVFLTRTERR